MPILRRAQTIPTPRGRKVALKVITGAAVVEAVFIVALLVSLAIAGGAVQAFLATSTCCTSPRPARRTGGGAGGTSCWSR
jgi:predicted phage tail protein